ncbi:MAG TPA: hypothetical protein VKU19_09490 [Bryobacteraceae bacterium]|nr:hypothetical protein [Bryobacteraceae bacterium]
MTVAIQPATVRYALLVVLILLFSNPVRSQRSQPGHNPENLPQLNVVTNVTLSPPYSCGHDNSQGYGTTALFLSDFARQRGAPELLFNGACGATDYFDGNTAGDDMSLIADLGAVPLTDVTTHMVFNLRNVNTPSDYTKFATVANIVPGHTYAAVINHYSVRGLLVFNVVRLVPDQEVVLQYEVKNYQINTAFQRSAGFTWDQ